MRTLKFAIPVLVLAACIAGAATLVATRPTVDASPPARFAPLVRVIDVQPETLRLRVKTQGTVEPRTESDLIPEVSGPIVWISNSLVSGGFFEKDQPLARIDPRDLDVALERARASLARTRSEHSRAKKELERVARLTDRNAASQAQHDDASNAEQVTRAALREASASLDQAERDRDRTEIRAPFAGRVREKGVDVGQFVKRGNTIAKIYAIEYVEIRLPIADDQLAFIDLPIWYRGEESEQLGPEVSLTAQFAGAERKWTGRIVRTEGEIDPKSRMVHVVARVDDPYGRGPDDTRPPLAVGLFVNAEILGREAEGVLSVPRSALNNDRLMVADTQDRLRFRDSEIIRRDHERVLIRAGLGEGDRVIVSAISTAVDGMLVRPVSREASGDDS